MCSDAEKSDCDSPSVLNPSISLTRTIHERFYCNREFAAATSLRRAGSPLATSTYWFQVCLAPWGLRVPVSQRDFAISLRTVMNNAG